VLREFQLVEHRDGVVLSADEAVAIRIGELPVVIRPVAPRELGAVRDPRRRAQLCPVNVGGADDFQDFALLECLALIRLRELWRVSTSCTPGSTSTRGLYQRMPNAPSRLRPPAPVSSRVRAIPASARLNS
jgi:hypothetical protein